MSRGCTGCRGRSKGRSNVVHLCSCGRQAGRQAGRHSLCSRHGAVVCGCASHDERSAGGQVGCKLVGGLRDRGIHMVVPSACPVHTHTPHAGAARPIFPFTAIVGQEEMKLSLILNVIDPKIGGVMIMGDRGTGKSTTIRALADLLPEINVRVRTCVCAALWLRLSGGTPHPPLLPPCSCQLGVQHPQPGGPAKQGAGFAEHPPWHAHGKRHHITQRATPAHLLVPPYFRWSPRTPSTRTPTIQRS